MINKKINHIPQLEIELSFNVDRKLPSQFNHLTMNLQKYEVIFSNMKTYK